MSMIDEARGHRTRSMAVRAEFDALLRRGGMRLGTAIAVVLGTGAGWGTLLTISYLGAEEPDLDSVVNAVSPVEVASFVVALIFSVAVVIQVGRGAQSGMVQTGLLLVPDRRAFLAGRAIALALLSGCSTLAVTSAVALGAVLVSDSWTWWAHAALACLAGTLGAVLMTLLACFLAVIVDAAVPALLTLIGWALLLPLAVTTATTTLSLPDRLSGVGGYLSPASLLGMATTVSSLPRNGPGDLVAGQLALATVTAVLGGCAWILFSRRDL